MLQSSHFLPDIGAGVRFTVSKKYHVNMRADYGQGTNGHTFGLGVLEAFSGRPRSRILTRPRLALVDRKEQSMASALEQRSPGIKMRP